MDVEFPLKIMQWDHTATRSCEYIRVDVLRSILSGNLLDALDGLEALEKKKYGQN